VGAGNTVPLSVPRGSVVVMVVNDAQVSSSPKMPCSCDPLTVVEPRVPTTCAWTIRGERPRRVTWIPTRLPLTRRPSLRAAAVMLIWLPQVWYGF